MTTPRRGLDLKTIRGLKSWHVATKLSQETNSSPYHAPMTNAKNASDEPRSSLLLQLLKAVEVAHETEDRHSTNSTSDAPRLEAHDDVLVLCRRERRESLEKCRRDRRVSSDILSTPSSFDILGMTSSLELPEVVEERADFDESAPVFLKKSAPVLLPTKHSATKQALASDGLPGLHFDLLGDHGLSDVIVSDRGL